MSIASLPGRRKEGEKREKIAKSMSYRYDIHKRRFSRVLEAY
jgi:hypothetical protein